MTANRLIERSAAPEEGRQKQAHCPDGYDRPQAWCDWANANLQRKDLKWIVGTSGTPMCITDPEWSEEKAHRDHRQAEAERHRFNWRQQHPVTEEEVA